jgi:hypothetical protein
MAFFPGTPKLESRNCPETVPGGVSGLWGLITLDCEVWLRRGLNQTCSPRRHLSNNVSHSQFRAREEVDSWLLVVGSQIANLTLGPSFAHNLGDRCPNGQCEAIFDIYASRPFQWHQEHPNARCFGPSCRALNIRESRGTPNLHVFQVLGFTPTLGQSRVATKPNTSKVGDLESSGTPECLEFDSKPQKTSHWGVLSVIGKVLKRRYLKWPRIGHSDFCSPSYGQKKGRESNWQFDSWPQKVRNRPLPDLRIESARCFWKDLDEGYNFGLDLVAFRLGSRELWASKVPGLQSGQFRDNFGTPTWESREKRAIWM